MTTALNGIKVIDLSRMAPGPFCTMVLGDLGADVLRVEQPGGGRMALARVGDVSESEARRRSAFNALNRNKRSIALNLKSPEAQEVLHGLVRDADVFVEGFRPGVVRRLGCDYETLSALESEAGVLLALGVRTGRPIFPAGWARHQLHLRWGRAWDHRLGGWPAGHPVQHSRGTMRAAAFTRRRRSWRRSWPGVTRAAVSTWTLLCRTASHICSPR